MAISPQRFTIYLYSAHRAVIFATAQISCLPLHSLFTSTVRRHVSTIECDWCSVSFGCFQECIYGYWARLTWCWRTQHRVPRRRSTTRSTWRNVMYSGVKVGHQSTTVTMRTVSVQSSSWVVAVFGGQIHDMVRGTTPSTAGVKYARLLVPF